MTYHFGTSHDHDDPRHRDSDHDLIGNPERGRGCGFRQPVPSPPPTLVVAGDAMTMTAGERNGLFQIDVERLTSPRPSDVNVRSLKTRTGELRTSFGCGFCRHCSPKTQGRIAIASCQARMKQ